MISGLKVILWLGDTFSTTKYSFNMLLKNSGLRCKNTFLFTEKLKQQTNTFHNTPLLSLSESPFWLKDVHPSQKKSDAQIPQLIVPSHREVPLPKVLAKDNL